MCECSIPTIVVLMKMSIRNNKWQIRYFLRYLLVIVNSETGIYQQSGFFADKHIVTYAAFVNTVKSRQNLLHSITRLLDVALIITSHNKSPNLFNVL